MMGLGKSQSVVMVKEKKSRISTHWIWERQSVTAPEQAVFGETGSENGRRRIFELFKRFSLHLDSPTFSPNPTNHTRNSARRKRKMCSWVIPTKLYQKCRHPRPDGAPYYDLCSDVQKGMRKMCSPLTTDNSKCKIVPGKCPSC